MFSLDLSKIQRNKCLPDALFLFDFLFMNRNTTYTGLYKPYRWYFDNLSNKEDLCFIVNNVQDTKLIDLFTTVFEADKTKYSLTKVVYLDRCLKLNLLSIKHIRKFLLTPTDGITISAFPLYLIYSYEPLFLANGVPDIKIIQWLLRMATRSKCSYLGNIEVKSVYDWVNSYIG